MSHLVNISQFEITEVDIRNLIGLLDPTREREKELIRKLLKLGNCIKRGNNDKN